MDTIVHGDLRLLCRIHRRLVGTILPPRTTLASRGGLQPAALNLPRFSLGSLVLLRSCFSSVQSLRTVTGSRAISSVQSLTTVTSSRMIVSCHLLVQTLRIDGTCLNLAPRA